MIAIVLALYFAIASLAEASADTAADASAIDPATFSVDVVLARGEATAAMLGTCSYRFETVEVRDRKDVLHVAGSVSQCERGCVLVRETTGTGLPGVQQLRERIILRTGSVVRERSGDQVVEEFLFPRGELGSHPQAARVTGTAPVPIQNIVIGDGRQNIRALRDRVKDYYWTLDTSDFTLTRQVTLRQVDKASNHTRCEWALDSRLGFLITRQQTFSLSGKPLVTLEVQYSDEPPPGFSMRVPTTLHLTTLATDRTVSFTDWRAVGPEDSALETRSLVSPGGKLAVKDMTSKRTEQFEIVNGQLVRSEPAIGVVAAEASPASQPATRSSATTAAASASVAPQVDPFAITPPPARKPFVVIGTSLAAVVFVVLAVVAGKRRTS